MCLEFKILLKLKMMYLLLAIKRKQKEWKISYHSFNEKL